MPGLSKLDGVVSYKILRSFDSIIIYYNNIRIFSVNIYNKYIFLNLTNFKISKRSVPSFPNGKMFIVNSLRIIL